MVRASEVQASENKVENSGFTARPENHGQIYGDGHLPFGVVHAIFQQKYVFKKRKKKRQTGRTFELRPTLSPETGCN